MNEINMALETSLFRTESDLRKAKITGAKVFASDFRVADIAEQFGWPQECAHALLVRAAWIDRRFKSLNIDRLGLENRPEIVITAEELTARGMDNTAGMAAGTGMQQLCPIGHVPQFLSQPLAILVFHDFLTYRRAAQQLREDRSIVSYGEIELAAAEKSTQELLDDWRTLVAPAALSTQHYLLSLPPNQLSSQFDNGPLRRKEGRFFRGDAPDATAEAIYNGLSTMKPGALVVETTTFTQQIDPAFLEPESGLAAVVNGTLTILTGTQSPYGDQNDVRKAVAAGPTNPNIRNVRILSADPGGGFGGRDKAPLSVQLALAAAFSDRPVRLAYDRFEQFQAGLKRHGSGVHSMISCKPDGILDKALVHFVFEGGAELNLSNPVMQLGALHATGFYKFNQASVHGVVTQRRIPIVGSMRGFGIPQVTFNIETAIDKLAVLKLNRDPIEVRRQNVLHHDPDPRTADRDIAGTPLRFHVATAEVCERAAKHKLWQSRAEIRIRAAADGLYCGVGFAGCMEAYGTSSDTVYAAVQLDIDGRVTVWSEAVDMGQGSRRSLGKVASDLFQTSARVSLGKAQPFLSFAEQLQPRGSTYGHASTSASKTAFFHVHVLRQACNALIRLKLFPGIRTLVGRNIPDAELFNSWRDGHFHMGNGNALSLATVAAHLDAAGVPRFAIAHGYFANGWSRATFIDSGVTYEGFIDALGFAKDADSRAILVPTQGDPTFPPAFSADGKTRVPRSGYAAGGHIAVVEIDPRTRSLRITDAVSFLDAGDPITPTILQGQVEGGFQMGLAHALFETLPPEVGQDRFVNFDRYMLPRASDIATINLETVLLPLPEDGALNAQDANIRHKGVGEVTMTTVAPAIANAIAHALGHHDERAWPSALPIRFKDLQIRSEPGA
ncbi:molybdopterin-dependent oxidoreductase [Bradyrhizobium sp. CB1717]|uniref:xanthine dehydrogenase family protein molybdopterin-binding subunit n=1 Tax=Bradyrhizobium sp. CB1717 TaxID=3039154 RepID=UPI0024B25237|nr:molybdopterin cofactor-binding domain-containing protein [Bradyrhizobium sp. CB1717]WFU25148.1 molybdopterin-dependent oxidoreductase [Bradyrhizobium sp. CB1717]